MARVLYDMAQGEVETRSSRLALAPPRLMKRKMVDRRREEDACCCWVKAGVE
jgi:hypothetical protein